MNKEKLQLIVTAIAIVILIVIVAGNLKKKPAKGQTSKTDPAQEALSKPAPEAAAVSFPAQAAVNDAELSLQKERAKSNWGRDPFTAAKISKEFSGANLQLRGISFGKDKKGLAFINNEIVKKGDIMGGYEVIEVEKHKVLLRKAEQTFYLTLPQE